MVFTRVFLDLTPCIIMTNGHLLETLDRDSDKDRDRKQNKWNKTGCGLSMPGNAETLAH